MKKKIIGFVAILACLSGIVIVSLTPEKAEENARKKVIQTLEDFPVADLVQKTNDVTLRAWILEKDLNIQKLEKAATAFEDTLRKVSVNQDQLKLKAHQRILMSMVYPILILIWDSLNRHWEKDAFSDKLINLINDAQLRPDPVDPGIVQRLVTRSGQIINFLKNKLPENITVDDVIAARVLQKTLDIANKSF